MATGSMNFIKKLRSFFLGKFELHGEESAKSFLYYFLSILQTQVFLKAKITEIMISNTTSMHSVILGYMHRIIDS